MFPRSFLYACLECIPQVGSHAQGSWIWLLRKTCRPHFGFFKKSLRISLMGWHRENPGFQRIWVGSGRSPACFRAWELPGAVGAIQIDGNESVRALGTPGGRPGHPWGDIDTKILQNQAHITKTSTNGWAYCRTPSSDRILMHGLFLKSSTMSEL